MWLLLKVRKSYVGCCVVFWAVQILPSFFSLFTQGSNCPGIRLAKNAGPVVKLPRRRRWLLSGDFAGRSAHLGPGEEESEGKGLGWLAVYLPRLASSLLRALPVAVPWPGRMEGNHYCCKKLPDAGAQKSLWISNGYTTGVNHGFFSQLLLQWKKLVGHSSPFPLQSFLQLQSEGETLFSHFLA